MAYPFIPIEHREYPNTFLVNTAVSLIGSNWNGEYNENFDKLYPEFVDRFFGIKKTVDQFKQKGELTLSSPEDELTFTFRPDKANLRVGRKKYHTFVETIMPELVPLKAFMFGAREIDNLENLQVRKLNIFPIQADSDDEIIQNANDVYRYLYTQDLMTEVSVAAIPNNSPWILDFRRASFASDEFNVTIRIGIAKSQGAEKSYNVVMDSSVVCAQQKEIGEGAIDRLLIRMNDQLFNAFHWCVADEIIKLMKQEVKV